MKSTFKSVYRIFWLSGLLLRAGTPAEAQPGAVVPGQRTALHARPLPHPMARTAVLQLPFFEDFSTTTGAQPDSLLWEPGSGVYVNNTQAVTHPSVNMATFDGLDAGGKPYNTAAAAARGISDTLCSRPVDLSALSPSDSLYFSFFWLAGGLGNLPHNDDYLELEFLDKKGSWVRVWRQNGEGYGTTFSQELIRLVHPDFFHGTFRFRFKSYGSLAGAFDTWHIDYIYFNKGRNAGNRYLQDLSVRGPLPPLLRRYTAMPFRHFFRYAAKETAATLSADIVNHLDNFNRTAFQFAVTDRLNGQVWQQQRGAPSFIGALAVQSREMALQPLIPPGAPRPVQLQAEFYLLTTDDEKPPIPGVNLKRNDTLRSRTDLTDYFAYDDGSAEFGIRMQVRQGKVAVRFIANEPDTLAGVRISLVPYLKDQTGQPFSLVVWDSHNGRPGKVRYQKIYNARYRNVRDAFTEFPFDKGVAVSDTFYVGWTQLSDDYLSFGLDRNSVLGSRSVLVNLGSSWEDSVIEGSIMIRPYNGGIIRPDLITASEPLDRPLTVFPNPVGDRLSWKGQTVHQIRIFTPGGRLVKRCEPAGTETGISVAGLPAALYIAEFRTDSGLVRKKIVLEGNK